MCLPHYQQQGIVAEDGYHCVLIYNADKLPYLGQTYVPKYYTTHSSMIKFIELLYYVRGKTFYDFISKDW